MIALARVVEAIERYRFRYSDEDELQQGLAAALEQSGFDVEREVILNPRDRIDLMVDRIGVEVKVAGQAAAVRAQCTRYCESDRVDAVVLVTNRARHLQLGAAAGGKPIVVVPLLGGGL